MDVVAMHMSDGLLDARTSLAFFVVAALGLAVALRRARSGLDERIAPLAGLVAAFVFALQMINFPVLPGVSGHVLGGALAAVLVGPATAALCLTVVLVVQSLLFADGGLTALGANVTNMALLGVLAGYGTAVALRPLLRRYPCGPALGVISFAAALVATVAAATGFLVEYAVGGTAGSAGTVAAFLLGTHVLIGAGEGLITAVTVVAVARARPDIVHLLRPLRPPTRAPA
ncbi:MULTISPECIES: energy-coupling factor ABC transporter permease [unclassified Rhodococcus (in: high G+C Gram-positive bacteria)]|uniref:energy-coupling factor ABC transporter permease n=1 Tax=unclassified Rhodococcus (in: high G+C Gram-positive bacteria) TaxID=192944 RepID=UPI000926AC32|nr:energy-coupling factor ABC transporter permease [Rhodococcus sp. M8]OLL20376.1 cobalamin biosynthesis protein CbiM [Rhodococcus sp. M8]QPG44223.1 energy-coupling factor ABC transporter permease [Rhodococcus sp. M8]